MKHDSAKNKQLVLKACQRNPSASIDEIATAANVSRVTAIKHLKALKQQGLVVHTFIPRGRKGAGKTTKTAEQRRIDRVVKRAKLCEQQQSNDVFFHAVRSRGPVRGAKVG